MRRPTHNRFAKMIIGSNDIRMKDIDKINGVIDRPSKQDMEINEMFNADQFDFLDLQNKATHRKYNHNPIGMIKAMALNPEHGAEIYMSHMMLDSMSNIIRDTFGTDNRDIAEVFFNRMLKSVNSSHKYYKSTNPFLNKKTISPFEKKMRRNKFYRMKNSYY